MLNLTINKVCSNCKISKPATSVYFHGQKKLNIHCKDCRTKLRGKKNWLGSLLRCNKCKEYKNPTNFEFANLPKLKTRHYLERTCKACNAKAPIEKKLKYKEQDKKKKLSKYYIFTDRVAGSRKRAIKNKLEHNIKVQDLKELWNSQNGKCALTGVSMTIIPDTGRVTTNMSLDRIDPNKGYTKDNIQLVCGIVNIMKYTLTIAELKTWCSKILTYGQVS